MLKGIKIITRAINRNPLTKNNRFSAWRRFIKWQFVSRLYPNGIVISYIGESKLLIKKSMHGATGAIYLGLQEFEDMSFLLHFLREDDHFIDVGANIGSYTILAACVSKANVISFEPIPQTFNSLQLNIRLNNIESKVRAINKGLGDRNAVLRFTSAYDTVNHVLIDNTRNDFIEVEVITLDDYFSDEGILMPSLIKIDVEGFELNVLKGAGKILQNDALKVIIVEINGCCNSFNIKEIDIHNKIISYGFKPYQYHPFLREFLLLESFIPNGNTIYIRDEEFVSKRLKSSVSFKVLDKVI